MLYLVIILMPVKKFFHLLLRKLLTFDNPGVDKSKAESDEMSSKVVELK